MPTCEDTIRMDFPALVQAIYVADSHFAARAS